MGDFMRDKMVTLVAVLIMIIATSVAERFIFDPRKDPFTSHDGDVLRRHIQKQDAQLMKELEETNALLKSEIKEKDAVLKAELLNEMLLQLEKQRRWTMEYVPPKEVKNALLDLRELNRGLTSTYNSLHDTTIRLETRLEVMAEDMAQMRQKIDDAGAEYRNRWKEQWHNNHEKE
jgi:hypothetical protein